MDKTKYPNAAELMEAYSKIPELELRIRDFMVIFAAIAFTQDDKKFSVPIGIIDQIKGASVDFSFNRVTKEYVFEYVAPEAKAEGKDLPTP